MPKVLFSLFPGIIWISTSTCISFFGPSTINWALFMLWSMSINSKRPCQSMDSKCGRNLTKRPHWKGFRVGRIAFSCRDGRNMERNFRLLAIFPYRHRNRKLLPKPQFWILAYHQMYGYAMIILSVSMDIVTLVTGANEWQALYVEFPSCMWTLLSSWLKG